MFRHNKALSTQYVIDGHGPCTDGCKVVTTVTTTVCADIGGNVGDISMRLTRESGPWSEILREIYCEETLFFLSPKRIVGLWIGPDPTEN